MIDFSHVPNSQQQRQVFYATTSSANNWQTWQKPRGAKMIQMFCIGGGGGGAAGSTTTTNCAGSGGGGASSYTIAIFPAFALPDTLYINVGIGGVGSLSVGKVNNNIQAANAKSGTTSSISISPSQLSSSIVIKSGNTAGGGGLGTSAAGSTTYAGAAGTKWTSVNSAISSLGIVSSFDGAPGTTTLYNATPVALTALSTGIVTGGTSGGNFNAGIGYNGGDILAAKIYLLSKVNGGIVQGGNGDHGYGTISPIFCGTGGAGGAANIIVGGIAGNGGNGFYGCGGGAGGSSIQSTTGTIVSYTGNGGRGGDGLVIITSIL